jgi:hypothetical protein
MKPDQTPDDAMLAVPTAAKRGGARGRYILLGGVAGACLLGAGLGFWARPAMSERQAAAAVAAATAPTRALAGRTLQIVVGDRATAPTAPIDVLRASAPRPTPIAPPMHRSEAPPPAPLPRGLLRIRDVISPAEPQPAPAERKPLIPPEFARLIAAALTPHKPIPAEPAEAAPVQVAKAATAPKAAARAKRAAELARAAAAHKSEFAQAALAKAQAQKAEQAKAAAHRLELARAAKAARQQQLQLAAKAGAEKRSQLQLAAAKAAKQEQLRLASAKAARQQQIRLAAAAKAEKQEQLRLAAAKAQKQQLLQLAKAEARGRAEALAEARAQARAEARSEALAEAREDARKRMRLASLLRAVQHALPHQPQARAAPPVELTKADRKHARRARHEAQVEQAALRSRRPARVAEPSVPLPRPSGLMKASAPRCANRDPGEAVVCADASLGAADRQLARAYQGARAAGVSEAQLQRQQQRWLAARSAAAREAPWAVHDVYLARIAELNGQARDAHGDGY